MGFGPTPPPTGSVRGSDDPKTTSPASLRGGVPPGSDLVSMGGDGLSAPRCRPPRRLGRAVPPGPIPPGPGPALDPGYHRLRVAGLRQVGPPWSRSDRAGRVALRRPQAGPQDHRGRRANLEAVGGGDRLQPSAVVRADPMGLVAPGPPAPRPGSPGGDGLLAHGRVG